MRIKGRKRKLLFWATTFSTTAAADHHHSHATCRQPAPWGRAAVVTRGGGSNATGSEDDNASLGREGSMFLASFEREVRQARQDLEQETSEAFQQLRRKILAMNREKAELRRIQREEQRRLEESERQRREEEEERRRQEAAVDQEASAGVEADRTQEQEGQPKATLDGLKVETMPSVSQSSRADELQSFASNDNGDGDALRGTDDELEDDKAADDLAIPETSLNEDEERFQSFEKLELFQDGEETPAQDFVVGDSDEEPDAVLSRVKTGAAAGVISSDDEATFVRERKFKVHSTSKEMPDIHSEDTAKQKHLEGKRRTTVVSGGAKAKIKKKKNKQKKKVASLSAPVTTKSSEQSDTATYAKMKKKKKRKKSDTAAVQSTSAESDQEVMLSAPGELWKVVFKGSMLLLVYFLTTLLVRLVLNSVMTGTG